MSQRGGDGLNDHGRQRLMRLLSGPGLTSLVPYIAPDVLHRLVRHVGLEQCVGLVEVATREQLTALLDLDLWGAQPGQDPSFDAERFGEWIEILVAHDAASAGRIVARFDLSLVATGLSRYVRVLHPGVLEPTESTDDEPLDGGLFAADGPTAELGGYIVQARRTDAWDGVVRLLSELSTTQPECFHAVMRECLRLSNAGGELDGLDDLLEPGEQLLHDLALGRDGRREERGFTTPADARAFLASARRGRSPAALPSPIALAYLRRAEVFSLEAADHPEDAVAPLRRSAPAPLDPALAGALDVFTRALEAEDVLTERPGALLEGGDADPAEPGGLGPLLAHLRERHPDVFLARGQELAFLANTLVAGCSLQSRAFTPQEASDAVLATCSLGLLQLPTPPGVDYLVDNDLVATFEDGWAALHRDVSRQVAEGLVAILRNVPVADSETLAGLRALRRSLATQLEAGTPWLAREALDALATLDTPAWHGLLGLLDECPVLPAIVTAIVERRTGRVDPRSFAFVATTAQLDTIRAFVARLPGLLAG